MREPRLGKGSSKKFDIEIKDMWLRSMAAKGLIAGGKEFRIIGNSRNGECLIE